MTRIEKFKKMHEHFRWGRLIEKLNAEEIQLIENFLQLNEHLDFNEFAELVNRMYLSTHGWTETAHTNTVQEILSYLAKTKMGFYGYHGAKRWVHPLDREKFGGQVYIIVDETEEF